MVAFATYRRAVRQRGRAPCCAPAALPQARARAVALASAAAREAAAEGAAVDEGGHAVAERRRHLVVGPRVVGVRREDEVRAVDHPQPRVRRRLQQRVLGLECAAPSRTRRSASRRSAAARPLPRWSTTTSGCRRARRTRARGGRRRTVDADASSERAHAIVRGAVPRVRRVARRRRAAARVARTRTSSNSRHACCAAAHNRRTRGGRRFRLRAGLGLCAQMANAFVPGAARRGGRWRARGDRRRRHERQQLFIAQRRRSFTPRGARERATSSQACSASASATMSVTTAAFAPAIVSAVSPHHDLREVARKNVLFPNWRRRPASRASPAAPAPPRWCRPPPLRRTRRRRQRPFRSAGRRRRLAVLAAPAALGHLADHAPRLDGVGHRARLPRRQRSGAPPPSSSSLPAAASSAGFTSSSPHARSIAMRGASGSLRHSMSRSRAGGRLALHLLRRRGICAGSCRAARTLPERARKR